MKKIKILGYEYEIIETECIEHGSSAIGQYSPLEQNIKIKKGLTKERHQQVLLHEVIHAILEQLNLHEQYNDEQLVQGLAVGLMSVIRDNPNILGKRGK